MHGYPAGLGEISTFNIGPTYFGYISIDPSIIGPIGLPISLKKYIVFTQIRRFTRVSSKYTQFYGFLFVCDKCHQSYLYIVPTFTKKNPKGRHIRRPREDHANVRPLCINDIIEFLPSNIDARKQWLLIIIMLPSQLFHVNRAMNHDEDNHSAKSMGCQR